MSHGCIIYWASLRGVLRCPVLLGNVKRCLQSSKNICLLTKTGIWKSHDLSLLLAKLLRERKRKTERRVVVLVAGGWGWGACALCLKLDCNFMRPNVRWPWGLSALSLWQIGSLSQTRHIFPSTTPLPLPHTRVFVCVFLIWHHVQTLTFDGDAGRYRRHPLPMATLGDTALGVVAGLTEEMDGALVRETSTRRRVAAETSVLGHQGVSAVAQSACRDAKTQRWEQVFKTVTCLSQSKSSVTFPQHHS